MEFTQPAPADKHAEGLAKTQRILDEMDRLEMRARLLLAEHRHVLATISDLQRQLEDAVLPPRTTVPRTPQR